jgi:hypothetical protein
MESKQPVEIINCKIQKQLHGDHEEMEVVIGDLESSDISVSPRKYDQLASTVEVTSIEHNQITMDSRPSIHTIHV